MTRVAYPLVTGMLSLLLAGPAQGAPAETQPADAEQENAALKEKVAALEARVKQLERQLRDARAGGPYRFIPTPAPRVPIPTPTPTPAPRAQPFPDMPGIQIQPYAQPAPRHDWVPRDINGIRYYLVPLEQGGLRR